MKLWKGATFAFMLCGAALSLLLTRNMATIGQFKPTRVKYPQASSISSRPSSSSPPSSSSSSSSSPLPSSILPSMTIKPSSSYSSLSSSSYRRTGGLQRRARSTDGMNSVFLEFSRLFQSFTEGELQQVVGAFLDNKRRLSHRLYRSHTRRTKRARRPRPCSLREVELTVSELGLGYESDETLLFRYCSGKCVSHRRNYDLTMDHMRRSGFRKKGRKDKVSSGPCCRPIAYEQDTSFLDNKSRYHTIKEVSAQECGCV